MTGFGWRLVACRQSAGWKKRRCERIAASLFWILEFGFEAVAKEDVRKAGFDLCFVFSVSSLRLFCGKAFFPNHGTHRTKTQKHNFSDNLIFKSETFSHWVETFSHFFTLAQNSVPLFSTLYAVARALQISRSHVCKLWLEQPA